MYVDPDKGNFGEGSDNAGCGFLILVLFFVILAIFYNLLN